MGSRFSARSDPTTCISRYRRVTAATVGNWLYFETKVAEGMPVPASFKFLSYLQGKADVPLVGNNVRDAIDQLRGVLTRRANGANGANGSKAAA